MGLPLGTIRPDFKKTSSVIIGVMLAKFPNLSGLQLPILLMCYYSNNTNFLKLLKLMRPDSREVSTGALYQITVQQIFIGGIQFRFIVPYNPFPTLFPSR